MEYNIKLIKSNKNDNQFEIMFFYKQNNFQ